MYKVLTLACLGALIAFSACKRESMDEKIKRDCEQFTQRNCPQSISGFQLDSLCYDIDSRTRSEYYTIEGDADKNKFSEFTLGALKNDLDSKHLKDEGINFRYVYRSATNGEILFEFTFTKEDYGQ